MRGMTIGQLAKAAGVGVETIRYYQRRGLIPVPRRPLGTTRRYPDESLQVLAFIRRGQEMGFTLEEISALLKMSVDDCEASQSLARAKFDELGERIETLTRMRDRVGACLDRGDPSASHGPCPLISTLNGAAE